MSISDTAAQVAAKDPVVGVAVATAQTNSAILAGLQAGDPILGRLLGAQSAQALQAQALLSSLNPALGQNVNRLG